MNSIVINGLIHALASIVLGTGILEHFERVVDQWADKEISGLEKKTGAVAQLRKEGLILSEKAFNRGIELALILVESRAKS